MAVFAKKNLPQINSRIQFRKTVKNPGMIEGIGLHSGEKMKLIFLPAEENTGLVFTRKINDKEFSLPVHVDNVIDTSLAVTLGNEHFHVQTVEHLLFSLFVLGITDLIIEIQGGDEVPITDGSSIPFIEALDVCELHEFPQEVEPIVIRKPVMVTDGDRYLVGLPDPDFKISYSIDYPHPLLKNRSIEMVFDQEFFKQQVGRARTFGFLREVELLKSRGLAQGGSTANAVVFTPDGIMNEMRFDQEPIFHKVLDLIGDLALVQRPIQGHVLCSKGGHSLDVAFCKNC